MEAHQRDEVVEVESEHLKAMLTKAEAESKPFRAALTKVEADLASRKVTREEKVVETKEKLAEVKKKATERAMEVYKALAKFLAKKAQAVVVFWTSKKF